MLGREEQERGGSGSRAEEVAAALQVIEPCRLGIRMLKGGRLEMS